MLYTTIKIKDKELKLRLNAKNCIDLERKLGRNPLEIFMEINDGKIPTLDILISMLHASLQAFEHGYTEDSVYGLYDEYVDDGGSYADLMPIIVEIFKVSGFMKEEKVAKKTTKKENEKN